MISISWVSYLQRARWQPILRITTFRNYVYCELQKTENKAQSECLAACMLQRQYIETGYLGKPKVRINAMFHARSLPCTQSHTNDNLCIQYNNFCER